VDTTAAVNFTLPAWDGAPRGIGISVDREHTRSVWYIGTDRALHSAYNEDWVWHLRENQTEEIWPLADKPNAELAVAEIANKNTVFVYYIVNGKLAEIKYLNDAWQPWNHVPEPPPIPTTTNTAPEPKITFAGDGNNGDDDSSGLSTGAKAGIGVGVSLGAIALGAIIAVLFLIRRKHKQQQQTPQYTPFSETASGTLAPDTPAPAYGTPSTAVVAPDGTVLNGDFVWAQKEGTYGLAPEVTELDGRERSAELDARPVYELPHQPYPHSEELQAREPKPKQQ